jgi:hypothetical protein
VLPEWLAFGSTGGPPEVVGTFQSGRSCRTKLTKRPYRTAFMIGAAGPLALLITAWPSCVAATLSQSISGLYLAVVPSTVSANCTLTRACHGVNLGSRNRCTTWDGRYIACQVCMLICRLY